MKKRTIVLFTALVLILALVAGCTANQTAPSATPAAAKTKVNVAALIGPTGMGLAKIMDDMNKGTAKNDYTFNLTGAPDAIVAKITTGEVDIAAVPTNLAASLYNKTNGKVQLLAINTLGVLYVVENGNTVKSLADLKGKTVYATGQGATPEYALDYILSKNGIDPEKDVNIEYKAEHSELATLVSSGKVNLAMLPEPFVTTVTQKNKNVRVALNLTKEWNGIKGNEQSELAMGVMIVRKDFAEQNPQALKDFLAEYKASTEYVNGNVKEASALIEKYGILTSAALAEKAIPNCNIVYVDGEAMKTMLQPVLNVLFAANPKSVGGKLPNEAFYYIAK
ncbi:MAG: ABC transporter substrate-binding protein [Bacillota bacterium]